MLSELQESLEKSKKNKLGEFTVQAPTKQANSYSLSF